jgi:cobalt-zinc-cadmium efflux system outer membrane protein
MLIRAALAVESTQEGASLRAEIRWMARIGTKLAGVLVLLAGCQTSSIAPSRPAIAPSFTAPPPVAPPAATSVASPPASQPAAQPFVQQTAAEAPTEEPRSELRLPPVSRLPTVQPAIALLPPAEEPIPPGATPPAEPEAQPGAVRLDLIGAIETSLRQNPDLTALRQNEGVSRGVLGVAQTYPINPYVQVRATPYQNNRSGGPGTVYHYVVLQQTIEWAHQQRFREESALAALTSVRWNILQAELLNLAQTERLFFTALYQRGVRDLVLANADLNRQLLYVVERQFHAGQASAADVAIIRLDSRSTLNQARLAEANYQTALLDLRRQLNLPLNIPLETVGDLTAWQWHLPDCDQWHCWRCDCPTNGMAERPSPLENLVAGRPDVMAARADLAAARANADLARASRRPNVQAGPYYERDDFGTTYLGFQAQSDVPVINTGTPLLRQRNAEVNQRMAVWQQMQTRAQLEAQAALDRYERARRIVAESSQDFRDTLPVELQRLEEQFKAGEVDILRVFTARTSLIQLRRAHLDTLNELAQAAANLSAATGVSAESLIAVEPAKAP